MKKDLIIFSAIIFLFVILFSGTKIQSVEDYYLTNIDNITEESQTVFINIDCTTVLNNLEQLDESLQLGKYFPESGVILEETEYVLRKGDTVFDILLRVVRYNKIHMAYQGANFNIFKSVYVQGISHLFEFSVGPLSGWMYSVNGVFPNYGCSNYTLKDGDVIQWIYTCDLGRDVGGSFEGING